MPSAISLIKLTSGGDCAMSSRMRTLTPSRTQISQLEADDVDACQHTMHTDIATRLLQPAHSFGCGNFCGAGSFLLSALISLTMSRRAFKCTFMLRRLRLIQIVLMMPCSQ